VWNYSWKHPILVRVGTAVVATTVATIYYVKEWKRGVSGRDEHQNVSDARERSEDNTMDSTECGNANRTRTFVKNGPVSSRVLAMMKALDAVAPLANAKDEGPSDPVRDSLALTDPGGARVPISDKGQRGIRVE
jgi:hypothetical protein